MLNEPDFKISHITKTESVFHESDMSFAVTKDSLRPDDIKLGFNIGDAELFDNNGVKHYLKMTRKEAFQLYWALSEYFGQGTINETLFNEVFGVEPDNSFIGAWDSSEFDEIERRLTEDE